MLFLIIFGFMFVGGSILLYLYHKTNFDAEVNEILGSIGAIFGSIGLLVLTLCILNVPGTERDLTKRIGEVDVYLDAQKQIRSMGEYDTMFYSITRINATIQKHKAYIDSPWCGLFYSKKIAEMEPYPYDGLKDPATSFIIQSE